MVKIVVVGAGGMSNVHLDNYNYIKNAQVVALVGKSEIDKSVAKKRNLKFYESLDDAIKSESFDIVDVTTPTFTHYDLVKKALLNSKSVICEKPFTLKPDRAQELFDLAKEQNCFVYVGQVVRFAKETQKLKEAVEDLRFGKVLDAQFNRLSSYPSWIQNDWLKDKSKSGLVPFDLHIHDLDLIISIFGNPKDYQLYKNGRENIGYSEFYRFTYFYDSFQILSQASWYNSTMPFTNNWRVVFENAVMVFDGNSLKAYPKDGDIIEYDISDEVVVPTSTNLPPTGWFYNELSNFVNNFENNKPSDIVINEQVLSVLNLLYKF